VILSTSVIRGRRLPLTPNKKSGVVNRMHRNPINILDPGNRSSQQDNTVITVLYCRSHIPFSFSKQRTQLSALRAASSSFDLAASAKTPTLVGSAPFFPPALPSYLDLLSYHLPTGFNRRCIPFFGLIVITPAGMTSSSFMFIFHSKAPTNAATMHRNSAFAKFCPMQLRGPWRKVSWL